MRKVHRIISMLLLQLALAPSLAAAQSPVGNAAHAAPSTALTAAQAAKILSEIPELFLEKNALSPDGAWVFYRVTKRSVATNQETSQWLLQRIPTSAMPLPAPVPLPAWFQRDAEWCADSRCIYVRSSGRGASNAPRGLVRYNVTNGAVTPVAVRDTSSTAGSPGTRPRVEVITSGFRWSPRGKFLAFTAPLAPRGGLDPRRGVPGTRSKAVAHAALFVRDTRSGIVTQLTPDSLDVADFAWAPDEHALAITVNRDLEGFSSPFTDIFVIDRASRAVRTLVVQPGEDGSPHWSPDGRWIAFETQHGVLGETGKWPAIIATAGGPIVAFSKERTPLSHNSLLQWSDDGRTLVYSSVVALRRQRVRVDVLTQAITMTPWGVWGSKSADGRWKAYRRESMTAPPELIVTELDTAGHPMGTPRQLTQLAPDFTMGQLVRVDTLSWRSPDGKFTIIAVLLTPRAAWHGGRVTAPLPTVLYGPGGPSAVRLDWGSVVWPGSIALAARGYAVLVPNTRGRGPNVDPTSANTAAFERAFRDDRSQFRGPYDDAMAGLDLLIARGVTDSSRLAVIGHSAGGGYAANFVTRTTRFRAAVVHEGMPVNLMDNQYIGPSAAWGLSLQEWGLYHDPLDSMERVQRIAESALLNVNRVSTPTLLLYGAKSAAFDIGKPLFHAFRRFQVPVAFFVYDDGHVFTRPAATADDLTRTTEWLDYWVRGIPFPDPERAKEYMAWKEEGKAGVATR